MRGYARLFICVTGIGFAMPTAALGATATFMGLGSLMPGGISAASAISADGRVVIGSAESPAIGGLGVEPFRWSQSIGMVGLGTSFTGDDPAATGVSADGSVVVGFSSQQEAFRWTGATGTVGLGFLPGDNRSFANAVSDDGRVVVGISSHESSDSEAFRWSEAEGMVNLGPDFFPTGLSANGDVIIGGVLRVAVGHSSGVERRQRWADRLLRLGGSLALPDLPQVRDHQMAVIGELLERGSPRNPPFGRTLSASTAGRRCCGP